jgi:hypothetical protein
MHGNHINILNTRIHVTVILDKLAKAQIVRKCHLLQDTKIHHIVYNRLLLTDDTHTNNITVTDNAHFKMFHPAPFLDPAQIDPSNGISTLPLDDLKQKRRYWKLKEKALDGSLWKTRFGRGMDLST